jgi:hypothetical protein
LKELVLETERKRVENENSFTPVIAETFGAWNTKALVFFNDLSSSTLFD